MKKSNESRTRVAPTTFPDHLSICLSREEWTLMRNCVARVDGDNTSKSCTFRHETDWFLTDEDEAMLSAVGDRIHENLLQVFGAVSLEGLNSKRPVMGTPAQWEILMADMLDGEQVGTEADGRVRLRIPVRQLPNHSGRKRRLPFSLDFDIPILLWK